MLYFLCKGANANTIWIVEQLGFAIILSFAVNSLALISGTTNLIEGSILQADELSITVVPTAANFGAHSKDVLPPAENKAISAFISTAVCIPTTLYFFPPNSISFPTDFSEATGINSDTGKFLSAKTFNIISPTIPVAPTTAILIVYN